MKKSKLLLFDYDGTIVDSAKMIVKGAIEAFKLCGLPEPNPKKIRENIGKTLAVALKEYMPLGYNVTPNQISEAYRNWYAEQGRKGLQDEPLFEGMIDLFNKLKNNKSFYLGIATNKSRIALDNGLEKHNLKKYFDITLSTDEALPKPDPEMAVLSMEKFNINNKSTIMVGDTISDMGLAKNANIIAVGVTWGYNNTSLLKKSGADFIVSSANDLLDNLENDFYFT